MRIVMGAFVHVQKSARRYQRTRNELIGALVTGGHYGPAGPLAS
jgi:hypothetical protein